MNAADRLGPEDWIAAALDVLAESGAAAVRVEPLAKRLGVTRGSFYWHFKDRRALLDALLDAWRDRQTDGVIAEAEALGAPPGETLRELLKLCYQDDGRLEKAFRAWAASDPAAAQLIAKVDARRVAYLARLLRGMGFEKPIADARARIAYRAWLGGYALAAAPAGKTVARDIDELYALLTA